jgi:hypothetical protein
MANAQDSAGVRFRRVGRILLPHRPSPRPDRGRIAGIERAITSPGDRSAPFRQKARSWPFARSGGADFVASGR